MQNIEEYTASEGCESSYADAKHDFQGIFKGDKIKEYVFENIPKYEGLPCDTLSEDQFVDKYELLLPPGETSANHKSETDFIKKHLNDNITTRYEPFYIERKQYKPPETLVEVSLLQNKFRELGILNDVFFICDVAYANVRQDLKFANERESQTFYWVQNAQTLYDPAGKTSWHSDKPYIEVEADEEADTQEKPKAKNPTATSTTSASSLKIDCPNHFKKENSRFVFCWQNAKKNIVTLYPEWSKYNFPTASTSYKFYQNTPEQMLYTNKNLFLSIRSDNVNDYSTHESYLIITDASKQGYFGYADKQLSSRGTGILNSSELASYRAKGNELKKFVKFINDSIKNPSTKKIFLDEVLNYSPYFQVLAKKVGDASQSLSCCQKEINLQRFKDNVAGPKKANNTEDFVSNGNHAFVSYDRIAIACALNYNCPIVIGNTLNGFTMYIRKDLINIHKQFEFYFSGSESNFLMLNQLKTSDLSTFILSQELYTQTNTLKVEVTRSVINCCLNLNVIPNDDITYQIFLMNHFNELTILQLFSTLDVNILHFNEMLYNESIKEIYNDKIKEIISDIAGLDIQLSELTDIMHVNNIIELMTGINNNIIVILRKLKAKYETLKPENTLLYTSDDPNHDTFVRILKIVKITEKLVMDINEKQKLILSNVESMKKIIEYQGEIEFTDNKSELNAKNVKNLPKGVASNITNYTPYTSYMTNARSVRNSDIFFERSTSIFGTTTIILQIFNGLNCSKLNKLKERFVQIVYNTLAELSEKATIFKNASFVTVIKTAEEQFNDLLIHNPEIPIVDITESNINELIDIEAPPQSLIQPADISESQTTDSQESLFTAKEESPTSYSQSSEDSYITALGSSISNEKSTEETLESPTSDSQSSEDSYTTAIEPEITQESKMREIFKNKKLFITKTTTHEDMSFYDRVQKIRNANEEIKQLFLKTKSDEPMTLDNPEILIAYENEIFIKGFIGLFVFMKYVHISTGKIIPTLFIKKGGEEQTNVLIRLFEMLYLNLNNNNQDVTLIERMEEIKKDIEQKIPYFKFDEYIASSDKKKYIEEKLSTIQRLSRILKQKYSEELDKYVEYYEKVKNTLSLYQSVEEIDNNPPIYKSDFTTYSFRKLLEMNVINVGDKPLNGIFEGINGNEINVNLALLYFIENRIASSNKDPIPHPELTGLFSQLFKDSGILAKESIPRTTKGGGEDDIFDTMYELFMSIDPTPFKEYRRNSYLLLNMPTNYEILINNFQSYPLEIRMYLQQLNTEYEKEKTRDVERERFKGFNFGKRTKISGLDSNNINNLETIQQNPINVFGGKTKKNKNKLSTKIQKTKKNKLSKTSNNRKKTNKIKIIKKIRKTKINK